jgi:hypothetical protein
MRRSILVALAAASAVIASPALAGSKPVKNTLPPPKAEQGDFLGGCDKNLTNPDAIACNGYYEKNVLSEGAGNEGNLDIQEAAIVALTGSNDLFNGDHIKIEAEGGGTPFDFGTELFGQIVIGAHFGNIAGDAGNVSVFYLFDFGTDGGFVTLDDAQGWSNAILWMGDQPPPAVPEPATWAMMLLGFGAAGTAMRRSRRRTAQISQLA